MELIINPKNKEEIEQFEKETSLLLPLKNFQSDYETSFTKDQIIELRKKYESKNIYVVINKMIFNCEIEELKKIMIDLNNNKITGIFFYDLSILQLKKELNLEIDLIWSANYMVTNYKTCNYYYDKGVKYALLSNEITKEEILNIKEQTKINLIITLIGYPTVATSRRKLVTNYNRTNNYEETKEIIIEEKITKEKYKVIEDDYGTTFKLNKQLNITSILNELIEKNFDKFLILSEGIEKETIKKIELILLDALNKKNITKKSLEEIENYIGQNTGFLYNKTIYKVKKDE